MTVLMTMSPPTTVPTITDDNESVRLVTVCVWRVDMRNTNLALQQLAAANIVNQSSTGSSFASDGESAVVLTV